MSKVDGPIMVPLAMITKAAMRNLDVRDADDRPVPLLHRRENGAVACAAMVHVLTESLGRPLPKTVTSLLRDIAFGEPKDASDLAQRLLSTGEVRGAKVFDPATLPRPAADLIRDLANNFLLIVLIPASRAGERQVLKFSFHWRSLPVEGTLRGRALAAFGYRLAELALEVHGVSDAASYHLEVHAPPELVCAGLDLPASNTHSGRDTARDAVAHAYGSYPDAPPADPTAKLALAVPVTGLRLTTLLVAAFTAAVFVLEQTLPGARAALLDAADGAVAILLAVPAVGLALLARPGENALASTLLFPLRAVVVVCATWLLAGAASLVGYLHEPFIGWLWTAGAWVNTALVLALVGGLRAESVTPTA